MEKNSSWKLVMVSDFTDCPSCDEPCGYIWFVQAEIDLTTGLPICINTRMTEEGPMLCTEDITCWTPRRSALQAGRQAVNSFVTASQGPLYKLKDFCKGGAYEKGIYERNLKQKERYEAIGLPEPNPELPDEILWPSRENFK